jgi:uncharacterized protein (TIGR03435 family)
MILRTPVLLVLTLVGPVTLCAQAQSDTPRFEVSSVKVSEADSQGRHTLSIVQGPGRIDYRNIRLPALICQAYGVKDFQIVGLDELNKVFYDIVATFPAGTTKERLALMLRTMLAERFRLKLHREMRVLPVYAVAIAQGGLKIHQPAAGDPHDSAAAKPTSLPYRVMQSRDATRVSGNLAISTLIDIIRGSVDRPVVDLTNLEGDFAINLEWSQPQDGVPAARSSNGNFTQGSAQQGAAPVPVASAPLGSERQLLFAALEHQLGLKVDARKSPVEMIVVDGFDRIPTEN